jgi:hypothetical protein
LAIREYSPGNHQGHVKQAIKIQETGFLGFLCIWTTGKEVTPTHLRLVCLFVATRICGNQISLIFGGVRK